jgi:hypothetical protein
LHFACAALNAGDEGSIPALRWKRKPPSGFGSGKLGTPAERMQPANASVAAAGEVGSGLTPAALVVALDSIFEPKCATPPFEEELPPQPASNAATLASAIMTAIGTTLILLARVAGIDASCVTYLRIG